MIAFASGLSAAIDLEDMAQDFVLETKKIEIAEYPDAFNPSLTRWKGELLLVFRIRDPETTATNQMGFVWLDDEFNPVGPISILDIQAENPVLMSHAQDPRLINVGDTLYIVFNSGIDEKFEGEVRRMYVSKLLIENDRFIATPPEALMKYDAANNRQEKNWVPFEYNGKLLLAYSLDPHRIFNPVFGQGSCETVASTKGSFQWDWGVLRGGTPALVDKGAYLAFFHSSKDMATVHSDGKKITHYFMGAYTFSQKPPFGITGISPRPIVGKKFYNGPAYKTWKPLRVVFPGGFVLDEKYVWVAYGRQDHEIWIVKLDKQSLLRSLVPVSTIN